MSNKFIISLPLFFLFCFFHNNLVHGQVINDRQFHWENPDINPDYNELIPKYTLGIITGVTRVSIAESEVYYKHSKISENYHPIFGFYIQKKLKNQVGLSATLSYKNLGFEAKSPHTNEYYNLTINNHYFSTEVDLLYFISRRKPRISQFSGIDLLYLLSSSEKYTNIISSHIVKCELRFDSMKDIMKRYTLSMVCGISYKFTCFIPFIIFVQLEYSVLSPTEDRILLEGDYNPLPYPYNYFNLSFKLNMPIYTIE